MKNIGNFRGFCFDIWSQACEDCKSYAYGEWWYEQIGKYPVRNSVEYFRSNKWRLKRRYKFLMERERLYAEMDRMDRRLCYKKTSRGVL
jgi:hypothetical protein